MSNKEKIIECAIDLFFRKGYESVGVQEICDVAGVTKPTLYHYFKSKYGLLRAILEEKYSEFGYKLEAAANAQDDIKHILHQVAKIYMEYSSANMKFNQFFMALQHSGKESEGYRAVRPYMNRMFNSIEGIFNRASYELGNMYGRQYLFATSFLGAMTTYLLMRYSTTDNEDSFFVSQEEIYNVLNQFLHGIYS